MPDSTFHESMGQGIYNLFCFSFLFVSLYFVVTAVFVFVCLAGCFVVCFLWGDTSLFLWLE